MLLVRVYHVSSEIESCKGMNGDSIGSRTYTLLKTFSFLLLSSTLSVSSKSTPSLSILLNKWYCLGYRSGLSSEQRVERCEARRSSTLATREQE